MNSTTETSADRAEADTLTPGAAGAAAPPAIRLRDLALAAVARACPPSDTEGGAISDFLRHLGGEVWRNGRKLPEALQASLRQPAPADAQLMRLARLLRLSPLEVLAVSLAAAVEDHSLDGRVLAHVQAPAGGTRPTLGLMAHAFAPVLAGDQIIPVLLGGRALASGLLVVLDESAPLPERAVMIPTPLCLALADHDGQWPGASIGMDGAPPVPLPESVRTRARQHAAALAAEPHRVLVLRSGSATESRSVATEIAGALHRRPLFVESEKLSGLGPWIVARGLLPVFCVQPGPGERRRLPVLPGYDGPMLAVCGPDGGIETAHGVAASWSLPVAAREERAELWQSALGERTLAARLAREYRHGTGRIADLGRLALHHAALAGRAVPERGDVIAAAWTGEGNGLEALAEPWRVMVSDEALVVGPALREDLAALMARCGMRDELAEGLGVSATTRYRPGVRALFTGPSGAGKTLAAGWIATRLGLPLYRVDLAAVMSKYIGETEKNLAQLLARAEQSEVILLFDEADSLFGKRTDIDDSNDRFANAQTNYLLQRIENYDGIVLLTSNSQARFDAAFARRLEFIIEFPPPSPEERRRLWRSHLGDEARIEPTALNELAALVEVSGGHIRNAVFAAAVRARHDGREVVFADLAAGVEAELRKLGRQMPAALKKRPGTPASPTQSDTATTASRP